MSNFSNNNRCYKQYRESLRRLLFIVMITALVTTTRAYAQGTEGEIHGTKWHDLNGNGIHDPGEPRIPYVVIFLDENNNGLLDTGEISTLTDANGDYAFVNLPTPHTYTVAEVITSTWSQSYPNGITVPSGNLLVTTGQFFGTIQPSRFYEFTDTGTLVQSVLVPYGTGTRPNSEIVRDIVVGSTGSYYIYNGTFNPYLTVYEPDAGSWEHFAFSGWSTVNNVSYGGIAIDENYVHLTDMWTANNGTPSGLVRFDTTNFSAERHVWGREYIDITRGLNGYLYALRYVGVGGRTVDVYDLEGSCGQINTITLGHEVRGIAVNAEGEIFGADWDDFIYHFSSDGVILNSVDSGGTDLTDIDIASDGTLVIGERFGRVILTDETLSTPTTITNIGNAGTFVAFASTPIRGGTHRVSLTDQAIVVGIDFGNYAGASLGDWVWEDQNENGVQDTGETGMEGITVNLICLGLDGLPYTNDDQVFMTTITDAGGYYSLGNIRPASYYLKVIAPEGYLFSPQNNAGNDFSDSDVNASGLTDVIAVASGLINNSIDAGLYQDPSSTPIPTSTPSPSPTLTPTPTTTSTPTLTPTPTTTSTPGPSPTTTATSTLGPSPTTTATSTLGPSPTATTTPGPSPTATTTPGPSPTPTATITPSPSPTPTATTTPSPYPTPTATFTPSPSPTFMPIPTPTATFTPSPSPTFMPTPTPTATFAPSPSATFTPTPSCVPVEDPILYWNDFEDGAGSEWSNNLLDTSPSGHNFLGQFNNNSTRLTISCLPAHEMLQVSFDLYIIRSWDGNHITSGEIPIGPDLWRFGVSNDTILVTTFSNWSDGYQAYPLAYPSGNMSALTGASEIDALGYEFSGIPMDAIYPLSFLISHRADWLELEFSALGLQSLSDESWGIDNVEVRIIDSDNNIYLPMVMR